MPCHKLEVLRWSISHSLNNPCVFLDFFKVLISTTFVHRVIFRWMTCKELQTISFEDVKPGSEEQLLVAFKTGKTTYARIFETLARYFKNVNQPHYSSFNFVWRCKDISRLTDGGQALITDASTTVFFIILLKPFVRNMRFNSQLLLSSCGRRGLLSVCNCESKGLFVMFK